MRARLTAAIFAWRPRGPAPGRAPRAARCADRAAVVLVGCFLMLQPLSTDLYLASLPGLTRTFAASVATVQLTLSVFVIALRRDAARHRAAVGPLRPLPGDARRHRAVRRRERRLRAARRRSSC